MDLSQLVKTKLISPNNFDLFTYSKKSHFRKFLENNFDEELLGRSVDPLNCDLKVYQDLLVYSFIKLNIKEGSKILDIGGGNSRILNYFKNIHECWNIDKLEGVGNGPIDIDATSFRLVHDYIGNFSDELHSGYFDLVFSVSTLEHVPWHNPETYEKILDDINRIMKVDGYSLHCIDIALQEDYAWTNDIIPYFFDHAGVINEFIPFLDLRNDTDLYGMSKTYFDKTWKSTTGRTYEEFGIPVSYNCLWKKTKNTNGSTPQIM